MTLLFAASGEIEKKSDPASEIVTIVSPAVDSTCVSARRPNGVFWSSRSSRASRPNCSARAWSLRPGDGTRSMLRRGCDLPDH